MGVPESTLTEVKPGGAFVATRARGIPVYIGVSSKGDLTAKPFGARAQSAIASHYGCGPLARKAAYCASQTSGQCVAIRVPKTQRAASHTTATVVKDNASDFTSTLSGTPTDGGDIKIKFTLGGTTGTGPIDYQVSTDGGATFGETTHLLTATSIAVRGVSVALGSGKVVTTNDTISWFQRAASAAVLTATTTRADTNTPSTSVFTPSGTPEDAYRVRVEFTAGGTVGAAGIQYRYCLDWNGTTGRWSNVTSLGTANTFQLNDGTEDSGLDLGLGAGTVDTGDVVEWSTTAPEASMADVITALASLKGTNLQWSFPVVLSPMAKTDAASLDTTLTGWAAATVRRWAMVETRDREKDETLAAWEARTLTEFDGFTSSRVFVAAGHAPGLDPITGRLDRWSCIIDYATRFATAPLLRTDAGQVTLGALPASRALYDSTSGAQLEHDARQAPSLFDRGFLTLRTWDDAQFPGTYPTGSVGMPAAGDLGLVPLRRLLDAFEDAVQSAGRGELVGTFRRWTTAQVSNSKNFKAGDIFEADARTIESLLRAAAIRELVGEVAPDYIQVTLSRTPVSLGGGKFKIRYSGKLVPPGYIYGIDGELGLVDAEAA